MIQVQNNYLGNKTILEIFQASQLLQWKKIITSDSRDINVFQHELISNHVLKSHNINLIEPLYKKINKKIINSSFFLITKDDKEKIILSKNDFNEEGYTNLILPLNTTDGKTKFSLDISYPSRSDSAIFMDAQMKSYETNPINSAYKVIIQVLFKN